MKIIPILIFWLSMCAGFYPTDLLAEIEIENVEYKIKAGYLFNFTKFITWPSDSSPSFNICIQGSDPFGELLNPIEQMTALGRPIRLFRSSKISEDDHCHIIFRHAATNTALPKGSLLVNDIPSEESNKMSVEANRMIGFINRQGKIKLQINTNNLQQAGLKVSAKLLEVAELVGENEHE